MTTNRANMYRGARRPVERRPVARRVAIASMSVLTASGIGLVAAPMAFGQIVIPIGGQSANVTNAGSGGANSGGNSAIGNASTNTATATATAPAGGLLSVPITLGAPANTSTGEADVTTGPATAVGNSAGTGVGQTNSSGSSGSQVNSFLAGQNQSAGVANLGSASSNSGGNAGLGNASQNNAAVNQGTGGGLVGVTAGVGGPTNTSVGNATITSGAASALGNSSNTAVGQSSQQDLRSGVVPIAGVGAIGGLGGAGIGAAPCSAGRFSSFQGADVVNRGQADANTGNNTAIGNASQNNASQTVTGGIDPLLGVGISIGGPVNNSTGVANITTGPATAVGNNSATNISQSTGCPQVVSIASGRQAVVVPAGRLQGTSQTGTLARTGLDTGDLGMVAGALLAAGMLLIASQRRRMVARAAGEPLAGLGFGLGSDQ